MAEQFGKDFSAEEFFNHVIRNLWGRMPDAFLVEEAVGCQSVDMRVEIKVFAEGVKGQEEGGAPFREIEGGTEDGGDCLLGDGAKPLQEAAITVESRSEKLGQSENVVAMSDRQQNMVDQVGSGALDFALMTGGAEPASLAGEGEEVLVLAVVTPDAGEAWFERAAVDELFHDLFHHRAERTVLEFVGVEVTGHESGLMPLGALPER